MEEFREPRFLEEKWGFLLGEYYDLSQVPD